MNKKNVWKWLRLDNYLTYAFQFKKLLLHIHSLLHNHTTGLLPSKNYIAPLLGAVVYTWLHKLLGGHLFGRSDHL